MANALWIVAAVGFGACIGSFLNVVIWRLPRGGSVVQPPSQCPSCRTRLRALDLVPVLSWLVLRGRCRTCLNPVSWRYPAVEVLTAAIFGVLAARFTGSWALPAYLLFAAVLVALSGIDLDTMSLPRRLVYLGGAGGVVLLALASLAEGEPHRLGAAVAGAALALALFFALHVAAPNGLGFGDVRLAALIGLYLGWLGIAQVLVGLFLGFLLGAVVGVAGLALRRVSRGKPIPFGPFMASGALVAVVAGQPLVALWLGA